LKLGTTDSESKAKELLECREIVQRILEYGVSQQQILRISYLLSLELEDTFAMSNISSCIKDYLDDITSSSNNDVIV
tara:strand:- start:140 stop:370 length:231 start_codon:yes stop_codon:yes gene_type:complete